MMLIKKMMDVTMIFDLLKLKIIILGLILYIDTSQAGSCSAAKLCCQGRDSGCVIQKESPNAIIESPRDKPCYCDHACLKLADCCDDFKETCGVVDCTVSEWSEWSACNTGCGSGTQKRTRSIRNSEKNGGKHCPRLDQIRSCRSFQSCHSGILRPLLHDRSVTLLSFLPAGYNGSEVGIGNEIPKISHRCVAFTIVRASKACKRISSSLAEGTRICVERQEDDMEEDKQMKNEQENDGINISNSNSINNINNNNNNNNNRMTSSISRIKSSISNSITSSSSSIKEGRRRGGKLFVGIGRWKLSTSVDAGSAVRIAMNSSCHGKWIGDSRHLIDCYDPTCTDNTNTTTRLRVDKRLRRSLRFNDNHNNNNHNHNNIINDKSHDDNDNDNEDYNNKKDHNEDDNYLRRTKTIKERCRRRRRARRRKRSRRRRQHDHFIVKS